MSDCSAKRPRQFDWPSLSDMLCVRDDHGQVSLRAELPRQLCESSWRVDFSGARPRQLVDWIGISSSGTTGSPKLFWRSQEQLMLEATAVSKAFDLQDVAEIVSFAPANHAFGFLCGIGMAYLHRAAFTWVPQLDRYSAYEPIDGERILLTLTASWQLLTRTPQLIRGVSRVVHSAGPVPEFAREILSAKRDCRDKLCEIFGSAEVGGLAFRRAAGESDTVWQLFDDVELKYCTSNNAWNVVGARVASLLPLENAVSDFRRMAFLDSDVEIADGRKIRIHGRRDMAIKVNGINVSLSELAETLGIALPDCPLALISERDPIRGEAFSVVMRSSNIPLARREHNERTVAAEIQRLYGEHVYPLRYSYSDIVERTASGKNKIILGSSRNG